MIIEVFRNVWDITHFWMNLPPFLAKINHPIKFNFAKEIGITISEEVHRDTNGLKSRLLSSLTINDIHIPRIVSHTNLGFISLNSASKHT